MVKKKRDRKPNAVNGCRIWLTREQVTEILSVHLGSEDIRDIGALYDELRDDPQPIASFVMSMIRQFKYGAYAALPQQVYQQPTVIGQAAPVAQVQSEPALPTEPEPVTFNPDIAEDDLDMFD